MQDGTITASQVDLEEARVIDGDAYVRIEADEGHMTIEATVEPPHGNGQHLTMEALRAALEKKGVVYGIDEEALTLLAAPTYDKTVVVARGTPAQDGVDGVCTELFPRKVEKKQVTREDGSVDYRQLGLITDLKAGTTICTLTPPVAPVDGVNALGQPVKGREGVKAIPPIGENVRLVEDGSRAETTITGNLVFRNDRFTVETVYRAENIDYDTGSIEFSGDVIVNGDVMDGFEIIAGGDVTLRGQAGSVVVRATNITIEKGMNGTGKAVLEARETLKAGFIENCNITAGKAVIANTLINSQVECEGDVDVTSGKGVICGGKVTAFGSVKAKEVGNDFNTLTTIVLGVTPKLLKERKRITDQLEDVTRHIDSLQKDVAYVERLVADGRPVSPDRVQMLKRVQLQLPMTEKKRDQLQGALDDLERKMAEVNTSTLTACIIHPPTKVSIGALSGNVIEQRSNCRVYKSKEGELVFGTA